MEGNLAAIAQELLSVSPVEVNHSEVATIALSNNFEGRGQGAPPTDFGRQVALEKPRIPPASLEPSKPQVRCAGDQSSSCKLASGAAGQGLWAGRPSAETRALV